MKEDTLAKWEKRPVGAEGRNGADLELAAVEEAEGMEDKREES